MRCQQQCSVRRRRDDVDDVTRRQKRRDCEVLGLRYIPHNRPLPGMLDSLRRNAPLSR